MFHQPKEDSTEIRAILLDLESEPVDSILKGPNSHLYNKNNVVTGKESSASNYVRAHYTIGREIVDQALDRIRKEAEKCNNFQGFNIHYSCPSGMSG